MITNFFISLDADGNIVILYMIIIFLRVVVRLFYTLFDAGWLFFSCLFLSLCVSAVDLFIWCIELQAQILLVFRGLKLQFEVIKNVCENYEIPKNCWKSKVDVLVLYINIEFVLFFNFSLFSQRVKWWKIIIIH